jgi:hypothetical protein
VSQYGHREVGPLIALLSLVVSGGSLTQSWLTRHNTVQRQQLDDVKEELAEQKRIAAEQNAYVTLALTLERINDHCLIAHTSLENRSTIDKEITAARLIVCPDVEDPWDTADKLLKANHLAPLDEDDGDPREFATVPLESTLSDEQRIFMPLDYYTDENVQVGDEILTYDVVIDTGKLRRDAWYSVRLVVVDEDKLHRLVHRAFVN